MQEKRYVLALDEGTSSARCVLFDTKLGKIVGSAAQSVRLSYPKPGWVEQDAVQLFSAQLAALVDVLTQNSHLENKIAGIGITNQRETVVAWDAVTKKPICPALVWQCRRTAPLCDTLRRDEKTVELIRRKTGLIIDPYFSATKIKWILDNIKGARQKAAEGRLRVGTVDSWLIYCLTGGMLHVTDVSNASRTMLFNINTLEWDDELLQLFGVPKNILPRVVSSDEIVGEASVLKRALPICGIIGDQQAALLGQKCFSAGEAKCTYGTGCFILANVGEKPLHACGGENSAAVLSTVAWRIKGQTTYAAEGSVFNSGSCIQWLRDNMKFISKSRQSAAVAFSAKNGDGTSGCDGVYVVPAFTGLGAPHWNSGARGLIIGITRNTQIAHIVRASLEAMAYSVRDVLACMGVLERGAALYVDGGAAANEFLMQFQADILGISLERPKSVEITATGAAFLCALGLGIYGGFEDILAQTRRSDTFSPKMNKKEARKLYEMWQKAVLRAIDWQ